MVLHLDSTDLVVLVLIAGLSAAYLVFWRKGDSSDSRPPPSELSAFALSAKKKSILKVLDGRGRKDQLVLFYGSQTGTAEDLATRLAKETSTNSDLPTLVCDLEDYDMEELFAWPTSDPERNYACGFFMATYGEGEPTDNAADFYSWIMDGSGVGEDDSVAEDQYTDSKPLGGLSYFIFGLGNSTYEHFNAIGKRLNKRMLGLGGVSLSELGSGDDDKSMEDDYLAWKSKILPKIASHFGITADMAKALRARPHVPLFDLHSTTNVAADALFHGEHSTGKPRRWQLRQKTGEVEGYDVVTQNLSYGEVTKKIGFDAKTPFYSKIVKSYTLFNPCHEIFPIESGATPPSPSVKSSVIIEKDKIKMERQCYHIELDISDSGLRYATGDHVGTWPDNDPAEVTGLIGALHLTESDLDQVFQLKPHPANPLSSTAKMPFPMPCSVRTALTHYVDLRTNMKQYQMEILAKYAGAEKERDALFELADDRDLYLAVVEKGQKTLKQVLLEFPSVKIPLEVVLGELLPRAGLRYYSISSSSKEEPNKVSLTAVLVRYAISTPSSKKGVKKLSTVIKQGLATSWFERLHEAKVADPIESPPISPDQIIPRPKYHIPIYIRTSNFKLPKSHSVPVVMVGPGTGVAPFRGFVRERFFEAKKDTRVGPTWLFYGCRHEDQDFLYRKEFEDIQQGIADATLPFDFKLITAFSRQGSKKVYVQHRLAEYQAQVWDMLDTQKGYFYVCGDAKHMASDVHKQLETMVMEVGKLSETAAKAWVKSLRSKGRYLEDVWS